MTASADTPLPAPRPPGAATPPADAPPSAAAPVAADDPFAMPLPAPKALGTTPVLPGGLTPAAVAAAASRRPTPPEAVPPSPGLPPPPVPAEARAAAPDPVPPDAASSRTAVAPPLPQRRPAAATATSAPDATATAAATAAPPPAVAEAVGTEPAAPDTPAVISGAAPVLPRPAPVRTQPQATAAVPASAIVPPAPEAAPAPAEPAAADPPATLAYAPAPGEAKPSVRWTGREGKLPPAVRAPAPASPAPATAVTPPPTPPGGPELETAAPEKPADDPEQPAALPTVARPTSADCTALLALGPSIVEEAPDLPQTGACGILRPVRLKALKMPDGRLVALSPAAELRCDMAAAATKWLRDDLVPALEKGGSAVTAVKVADDYSCRPRNRVKGARMSEHGRGNAIDIGGFKLADGRVLEVAGNGLPKPFRVTMRATACARFKTILGPGSDGYHENHIHVDLADRRSKRSYCRWRIPGTDAS